MTTLELYETAEEKSRQSSIGSRLMSIGTALAGWRARRQTVLRLASLDAIQLGDIGLEPLDVQDALDGDAGRLWAKIGKRNAS